MTPLTRARAALAAAQQRTAVFSGAGLSAESGIATFRGNTDHALWSQFNPLELASPDGFDANPERVIDWYNWRRTTLAHAQPNAAHRALAQHPRLMQITQNVDDLLERAGVPAHKVLHLHGTIGKDRCNAACGHEVDVDLAKPPPLRNCPRCGAAARLRPAVVWFGEPLPPQVWSEAQRTCEQLACLIVVGTSATVYPAAGLIEQAAAAGSTVITVNPEPALGPFGDARIELVGTASAILPPLLEGLDLATHT